MSHNNNSGKDIIVIISFDTDKALERASKHTILIMGPKLVNQAKI